jgi:hypothetical protein
MVLNPRFMIGKGTFVHRNFKPLFETLRYKLLNRGLRSQARVHAQSPRIQSRNHGIRSCTTYFVPKACDHCPWPSLQFNKWQAQNKLLPSSLIVIGREQPLVHSPLTPANHCRRKACFIFKKRDVQYISNTTAVLFVNYDLIFSSVTSRNIL